MDDKEQILDLFSKVLNKTCSPQELERFTQLSSTFDDDQLSSLLEDYFKSYQAQVQMGADESEQLLRQILEGNNGNNKRAVSKGFIRTLLKYAAILVGGAILFSILWKNNFWQTSTTKDIAATSKTSQDIAPGMNGAILTLANGQKVLLDSNGLLQHPTINLASGTTINIKNGTIQYQASLNNQNQEVAFNTLSTPASRTFHVQLPDGTQVWLNAASSIKYPTRFSPDQREVTISGEAYFEVAKLMQKNGIGRVPFIVHINAPSGIKDSKVEVLGTHFNINAYADDGNIRTTLLEGKVNVYSNDKKRPTTITPGVQAITSKQGSISLQQADLEKAVAWKAGYFDFNQADLPNVLNQISRWYNLDIIYPDKIPERTFWGKIQRSLYLSQVLSVLESAGVHFRLEGKRLIVQP